MNDFVSKHCVPCERGMEPLHAEEIEKLSPEVPHWRVENGKKITREFRFKNFVQAVDFVNRVADVAELEDHHPDIHIHYNRVVLELWTHAIGGLSENDFILAAKIDRIV